MNRIQSSRRLERETQRNVELMWLTGRLTPDFKTIADFRKDNGKAIRSVCRRVHRAVPTTEAVLRGDRGDRRQQVQGGQQPRQELHRPQAQGADAADWRRASRATDGAGSSGPANRALVTEARVEHTAGEDRDAQEADARAQADRQANGAGPGRPDLLTDPDARSMATSGRGTGMVGYNVQTAVDTKHHMIVAHEVTNVGHDRDQLTSMAHTRPAMPWKSRILTVLADRGYFKSKQILEL